MSEPNAPSVSTSSETRVRGVAVVVFVASFVTFAWFFQGSGENQNAHFSTVRALAEHHTFDITAYAASTRDTVARDGRIYSNKLPGLPLLGLLAYWPAQLIERFLFHADLDAARVRQFNHYLVTLLCSAVPAAITTVTMHHLFHREGMHLRSAALLALAFALGTLTFPFAGVLMVHNLVAMCIVLAWCLLTSAAPRGWKIALAGLLMGLAILADHLTLPVVVLLIAFLLWDRQPLRSVISFVIGPLLGLGAVLWYRAAVLGHPFDTGVADESALFVEQHLLFGVLGVPDVRRVYWLSFHPFRGLFYCCPIMLLPLIGLFHARRKLLTPRLLIPLAIAAWYVLFNLSFNGWTGGVGVGPRYLIPALPMLFLFAPFAVLRHRLIAIGLSVLSMFIMFSVTAVRLMHPWANNVGPPLGEDPVATSIERLLMGDVARNVESFNLGLAMGLPGRWSLVPPMIIVIMLLFLLQRLTSAPASVEEVSR